MSDTTDPEPQSAQQNPFSAPTDAASELIPRPTGVTVTGVLCVLFGIMGVLMSVLVMVQFLVGTQFASAFAPAGAAGDAQREMNAAIDGVTQKFLIPNIGIGVGGLALAVCLIVGGIALFMPKLWATTWVRRTLLVMIGFELFRQVVYIFMQIEMYPITQEAFAKMGNAGGGGPSPAMMKSMQKISVIFGIVFGAGWAMIKLTMLVWGYRYLGRQHVSDYIAQAAKTSSERT